MLTAIYDHEGKHLVWPGEPFDRPQALWDKTTVSQVLVNVPESAPLALKVRPEEVGPELLLAAAVKLYEIGRLSSGAAAELAGMSKPLFLQKLAEYGVAAFRLNEPELREDQANA